MGYTHTHTNVIKNIQITSGLKKQKQYIFTYIVVSDKERLYYKRYKIYVAIICDVSCQSQRIKNLNAIKFSDRKIVF